MSALGLGGYFEQEDANEESSEDEESLDQDNSPNGKTNNVEGPDDPIQAGCSASAKLEVSTDGVQDHEAARKEGAEPATGGVTPEHTQGQVQHGSTQVAKADGTDPEGTAKGKAFSVPGIPDAPDELCEAKWQQRVSWVLQQQSRMGKKMIRELQDNKTYRNPRFMEKVIKEERIAQYGTCFPKDMWDPEGLPPGDFLKSLKRQLDEKDILPAGGQEHTPDGRGGVQRLKRARQPAAAPKPAAHKGGVHPGSMSASAAAGARIAANMSSKRSKWDQGTKDR